MGQAIPEPADGLKFLAILKTLDQFVDAGEVQIIEEQERAPHGFNCVLLPSGVLPAGETVLLETGN